MLQLLIDCECGCLLKISLALRLLLLTFRKRFLISNIHVSTREDRSCFFRKGDFVTAGRSISLCIEGMTRELRTRPNRVADLLGPFARNS